MFREFKIFYLVLLATCLAIMTSGGWGIARQFLLINRGIVVEGKVISKRQVRERPSHRSGGLPYVNVAFPLGINNFSREFFTNSSTYYSIQEGNLIEVLVDPANPSDACLYLNRFNPIIFPAAKFIFGCILCISILYVRKIIALAIKHMGFGITNQETVEKVMINMAHDISVLPEHLQKIILDVLKPNEKVLWFHRDEGNQNPIDKTNNKIAVGFGVLLGIGVIIFSLIVEGASFSFRLGSSLVGVFFLVSTWMGSREPAQQKKRSANIVYVVTNKRALLVNGNFKKDAVDSYAKEYIGKMSVELGEQGRGSIIFENSYGLHPLKIGFEDIPNVAEVAKLLKSIDAMPGDEL